MTNRLRTVREKLGLSQEAAARLLNVSLQSVNRWERGKWEPSTGNDTVLALLPILAAGEVPKPCATAKREGFNIAFLSRHVRGCPDCRLAVAYLTSVAK
jgi:transcriptional regulator with XRE-family HTH domain